MGTSHRKSRAAWLIGIVVLTAGPAWAQQAATPAEGNGPAVTGGTSAAGSSSGGGGGGSVSSSPEAGGSAPAPGPTSMAGYGAPSMFSAFPNRSSLLPAALQPPGMTPAFQAPRAFAVSLGMTGDEKWTDNALLTAGAKQADFITSADPSLGVNLNSRRVKADLSYDLGYDKYARDSRLDGFRQNGLGSVNAELLDKLLFLDGRASVSEQAVSPTGALSGADRTAASNLTRVFTESIGPRLQEGFGDWALSQLSYHHDMTHNVNASKIISSTALAPGLGDNQTDGGRIELRSGQAFSQLLWDYTGDVNHTDGGGTIFDQLSHTVGAEWRLSREFGLLATGGDDYLHSNTGDLAKYGGAFYSGGIHWTPSPNAELRIGGGRRYDRPAWSLLADYRLGVLTDLRLSVDSGVTTDSLSFEQALNSIQRDEAGNFVDPFSGLAADPSASPFSRSNAVYWIRTSSLALRHGGVRDTFSLIGSVSEQKLLSNLSLIASSAATAASSTVLQADFQWSHNFTRELSGVVDLSESNSLSDGALGSSKRLKGSFTTNYTVSPTLTATLGYTFTATLSGSGISPVQTVTTGDIRENMVMLSLHKKF